MEYLILEEFMPHVISALLVDARTLNRLNGTDRFSAIMCYMNYHKEDTVKFSAVIDLKEDKQF
jgi:hypothetical protein